MPSATAAGTSSSTSARRKRPETSWHTWSLGFPLSSSCVALCLGLGAFLFLVAPSLVFLSSPPSLSPFPFPTTFLTSLSSSLSRPTSPPLLHSSHPPASDSPPSSASQTTTTSSPPDRTEISGTSARGAAGEAVHRQGSAGLSAEQAQQGRTRRSAREEGEQEGQEGGAMAAIAAATASLASVGNSFVSRKVVKRLLSREQDEGDGARVRRSIGRPEMKTLDPFLLLDEFRVSPPAGFPDHPHRGFETVTYMLKGRFHHEDFDGHKGEIGPGDLQWMTAGRGIMHAEMPAHVGESHGLQLWVNLAAKDKMVPSSYQELLDSDVPKVEREGVRVAVIAGESMGVTSPVHTRTPTMYLSFSMQPGSHHRQAIPEAWNAFVYTLSGKATFGEESAEPSEAHTTLQLGPGQGLDVWNKGPGACAFVLIGGQPLGEPVVQYGPFVMNTEEEIMQTIGDLRAGKNGFERARGWASSIRDGVA